MGALVLQALEPAVLESSLQVAPDGEAERRQGPPQGTSRLERAQYAVARAARQYHAVEPENRLVARTLERQWEETLAEAKRLQGDYARFLAGQPTTFSSAERDAMRRLASDLPALWRAPGTTEAERQAISRQLVDHVVVTVHGKSAQGTVHVHWGGGHRTEATLICPVARVEQLRYSPQVLARVAALYAQGADRSTMAQTLPRAGWRPAKRTTTFSALMVGRWRARHGRRYVPPVQAATLTREAHAWTVQDLEQRVGSPEEALYAGLRHGRLTARHVPTASHPRGVIGADASELDRLRTLRKTPRTWSPPLPIVGPGADGAIVEKCGLQACHKTCERLLGICFTSKRGLAQCLKGFDFLLTLLAPLCIGGALSLGLALLGIDEDPALCHAAIRRPQAARAIPFLQRRHGRRLRLGQNLLGLGQGRRDPSDPLEVGLGQLL